LYRLVSNNDETVGFDVLGATCHPTGLQDAVHHIVGNRLIGVDPKVALGDDGFVRRH
jgi:hypothetical protein